ncbi:MAG: hypothetical protein KJ674_00020 [Nanoarchaeota archaeon]|nr:hypothetical protein [Nanoarchaeota archaeon]
MENNHKIEERDLWNPYNSRLLNPRNRKLCLKAYKKFPKSIKRKIAQALNPSIVFPEIE